MWRPASVFAISLLAIISLGCFKHTYTVGSGAADGPEVYRQWQHHWLFGLVRPDGQKNIDIAKICPSGNATIHQKMNFLNGLVSALIGFIYSPRTVTIQCDDGTQTSVELSSDDVARIVSDPLFLAVVSRLVPERLTEAESAFHARYATAESWGRGLSTTAATSARSTSARASGESSR